MLAGILLVLLRNNVVRRHGVRGSLRLGDVIIRDWHPVAIVVAQLLDTPGAFLRSYILEAAYYLRTIVGDMNSSMCHERGLRDVSRKVNIGVAARHNRYVRAD
jgi:hypothetical protein